jgi:hypothetical protein
MNLVAVETPSARVALSGKFPELLDAPLGIIAASQPLQIITDQLIETLAKRLRFFAGTSNGLLIY